MKLGGYKILNMAMIFHWSNKALMPAILSLLTVIAIQSGACGGTSTVIISNGSAPDPSIVFKDGFYYMTHTTSSNITLYKSETINYRNAEKKVIFNPPDECSSNVWAPELQYLDGKWVIYFTGSRKGNSLCSNQRSFAIEADTVDPMGNWTYKGKIFDKTTDQYSIDAVVLELGEGTQKKKYFIWSGLEHPTSELGQVLYIAPMSDRYTISGPRVELARAELDWEIQGQRIMEGPQPLIRNGKVFLIYSTSWSWTADYKLGMLYMDLGKDPLVKSNWTKYAKPVFQRNDALNVYGPGHNTFTKSPDGTEDWIVYHATPGPDDHYNNRLARAQRFIWDGSGFPVFGMPH